MTWVEWEIFKAPKGGKEREREYRVWYASSLNNLTHDSNMGKRVIRPLWKPCGAGWRSNF